MHKRLEVAVQNFKTNLKEKKERKQFQIRKKEKKSPRIPKKGVEKKALVEGKNWECKRKDGKSKKSKEH